MMRMNGAEDTGESSGTEIGKLYLSLMVTTYASYRRNRFCRTTII